MTIRVAWAMMCEREWREVEREDIEGKDKKLDFGKFSDILFLHFGITHNTHFRKEVGDFFIRGDIF